MTDLSEGDAHAQGTAIRILSEAGFHIDGVSDVTKYGSNEGVEFTMTVRAPTAAPFFGPQSRAVKSAAMEAAEFDMAGKPVEDNHND